MEVGQFDVRWDIRGVRHGDVALLDVLATLLGAGRSSRLFQEVREKKALVNSVDAWTYTPGNPGLFGMSAVVEPDKFDAAHDAMLEEVEKIRQDGSAPEELTKAVKQFTAATRSSRQPN